MTAKLVLVQVTIEVRSMVHMILYNKTNGHHGNFAGDNTHDMVLNHGLPLLATLKYRELLGAVTTHCVHASPCGCISEALTRNAGQVCASIGML